MARRSSAAQACLLLKRRAQLGGGVVTVDRRFDRDGRGLGRRRCLGDQWNRLGRARRSAARCKGLYLGNHHLFRHHRSLLRALVVLAGLAPFALIGGTRLRGVPGGVFDLGGGGFSAHSHHRDNPPIPLAPGRRGGRLRACMRSLLGNDREGLLVRGCLQVSLLSGGRCDVGDVLGSRLFLLPVLFPLFVSTCCCFLCVRV